MQQERKAEPGATADYGKLLDWGGRPRLRALVLLALTILSLIVCYLLALPFLPALTWALALAILFLPAHRWLEKTLHSATAAAFLSVMLICFIVVFPALLLIRRLMAETARGVETLSGALAGNNLQDSLSQIELLQPALVWFEQVDLGATAQNIASWLADWSASLATGSVIGIITFLMTFYLLFYFLRDRHAALDALRQISPLTPAQTEEVFGRVSDIVHATLYGTVMVAIVQGVLGGLAFWWLEIPMPLVWGTVMGLLALVPVLGAFVIWIPAAFFLALQGEWQSAIILIVWGAVVVGGIDNLLYPMLVGQRLRLHTVPTFIAILGGLVLFGSAGLLLGPIAVALALYLLSLWNVDAAPEETP